MYCNVYNPVDMFITARNVSHLRIVRRKKEINFSCCAGKIVVEYKM